MSSDVDYLDDENTEELYSGRLYGDMVNDLTEAGMNGVDEFLDANVVIERQETSNMDSSEDGIVLKYNRRSILSPFTDETITESYPLEEVDAEEIEEVCEEFN
jgi:hypothetical protein